MAGAIAGVPTLTPKQQPDWYILQHEQCHFAITEVAARKLAQRVAKLEPEQRTQDAIARLRRSTMTRVHQRHGEFDSETSGTFDPRSLEKWVRVLEVQLQRLCGPDERCPVRTPDI
jgi:predicted secreted Zn-dependent protease